MPSVQVEPNASTADVDVVRAGLLAFNVAQIGDPAERPLQILLRRDDSSVIGGLLGHIRWRWAYVAKLWVADDFRGQGYGVALMAAAEAEARTYQCIGVFLDTFEYQARPFYEKLGYTLFGTLEDYPPGWRQFFLAKTLT